MLLHLEHELALNKTDSTFVWRTHQLFKIIDREQRYNSFIFTALAFSSGI